MRGEFVWKPQWTKRNELSIISSYKKFLCFWRLDCIPPYLSKYQREQIQTNVKDFVWMCERNWPKRSHVNIYNILFKLFIKFSNSHSKFIELCSIPKTIKQNVLFFVLIRNEKTKNIHKFVCLDIIVFFRHVFTYLIASFSFGIAHWDDCTENVYVCVFV